MVAVTRKHKKQYKPINPAPQQAGFFYPKKGKDRMNTDYFELLAQFAKNVEDKEKGVRLFTSLVTKKDGFEQESNAVAYSLRDDVYYRE